MYLTLVSNASQSTFPDNRKSVFTTLLPSPINLSEGVFEIALCELFIPFSLMNLTVNDAWLDLFTYEVIADEGAIGETETLSELIKLCSSVGGSFQLEKDSYHVWLPEGYAIVFESRSLGLPLRIYGEPARTTLGQKTNKKKLDAKARLVKVKPIRERVKVTPEYYESCKDIVEELNTKVDGKFVMSVNEKNGIVKCDSKVDSIRLSNQLGNLLGFRRDSIPKGISGARHAFDPFPGCACIFVYSDIISDEVVGDTSGPLLRVLPLKKAARDAMIGYTLDNLQYRTIIQRELTSITLSLYDDVGRELSFKNVGRTAAVCHIRRRQQPDASH
jgi:hypothetical protein